MMNAKNKLKALSKNQEPTDKRNALSLSTKEKVFLFGLFTVLAYVLYFQCLPFGYVLDDKLVLSDNQYTKSGIEGIPDLLTKDSFSGYFGEQKDLLQGGRYRPLSLVTFAIETEFFGLNPRVSHAVNIFLYGLSCFILFLTLRTLLGPSQLTESSIYLTIPFLTTMLFLVHPLHTEAVANIKGRDEIMALLFGMMTLYYSLKFFDFGKYKQLLLAVVFLFLGLLSKENVITFIAVIPFALMLFRTWSSKAFFTIMASLLACICCYLILRYQVIGYLVGSFVSTDLMNNPFVEMNGSEKYATIFYTLLVYLKLCIFPYPLTHDYYPYHIPIMAWSNIWVILSLAFHITLGAAIIRFWKSRPIISFGLGFYIITISIVSNLVVGVGTFMNERFIFISSAGICLLLAYFIHQLAKKVQSKISYLLFGLICLAFAVLSFLRVPAWETELSLNKAAIKVSKNSARANSFMGTALFNKYKETQNKTEKKQLLDEAIIYVDKSLEIIPDYSNGLLMKAGIAAEHHKMGGSLDDLLESYAQVIPIRPSLGFVTEYLKYINTREDIQKLLDFYLKVGYQELMLKEKNHKWGIHFLNFGYELAPDHPQIRKAIAEGYMAIGNRSAAERYK